MSKADIVRSYCLSKVGLPYQLGEEFDHPAGPILTGREDGDCSGIFYAACVEADVRMGGKRITRETADTYYRMGTIIERPVKVGDCCWFPLVGPKTHMAVYIGKGQVFEAGNHGPGGVYPGHGYVGLCTVQQMEARNPVWGRLNTDIGELTEDDMTPDEVRTIVREELATTYAPDLKEATEGCARLGLLETKHSNAKPISTALFRVALYRLAKKAGLT